MKRLLLTLALFGSVASVAAQRGMPATGINAAMLKMFGEIKAFTATAEARLLDKNLKEISSMPMTMSLRDNKLRSEMDLSQAKGQSMPPEAAAMMKQAGMDRMVTLVRPEQKTTLIMYPGLKSYAEIPISEEESAEGKVESTELGKEEIDGHPCTKTKLTSTNAKGDRQEAFVWQASDIKKFPLQMQMAQRSNTLIVKFQPPKLESPDASLFELPAGYAKYPSVQALMQAAMMKMFGGAGEK